MSTGRTFTMTISVQDYTTDQLAAFERALGGLVAPVPWYRSPVAFYSLGVILGALLGRLFS